MGLEQVCGPHTRRQLGVAVLLAGPAAARQRTGMLVEAVQTQPGHQLPLGAQVQLVLHVEGLGGVALVTGRPRGAVGRHRLAVDRRVDVDTVRGDPLAGIADVVLVDIARQHGPGQHGVPDAGRTQFAGDLGLQRRILRRNAPPRAATGQRAAIGLHGAGLHAQPVEQVLQVHDTGPHAPGVIEGMVDGQLVHIPLHMHVGQARFAQIAAARQRIDVAVDHHQPAVEGGADAGDVGLVVHDGAGIRRPGDGRRQHIFLPVDQRGAGGALLGHGNQPVSHRLRQRTGEVHRAAAQPAGTDLQAGLVPGGELRLLRHAVVGATRFAAAIEGGRRPLQELDPLHRGRIALRTAVAAGHEAVDQ